LEDRAGNIWVGTRNTSLFRYDGKTFTNYTEKDEKTESLIEDKLNPFGKR
jgi:ligand-binding sensor domain-containing protein